MCLISHFPEPGRSVVQGPPYNQISCELVRQRRERAERVAGLSVEEYRERELEQKRFAEDQHEAWLRGER